MIQPQNINKIKSWKRKPKTFGLVVWSSDRDYNKKIDLFVFRIMIEALIHFSCFCLNIVLCLIGFEFGVLMIMYFARVFLFALSEKITRGQRRRQGFNHVACVVGVTTQNTQSFNKIK